MNIEITEKNEIKIPLILINGLHIYPGISLAFDAVDDQMVSAIQYAQKSDNMIFVFVEDVTDTNDNKLSAAGISGCTARIRQIMRIPGSKGMKVIAEGVSRGELLGYEQGVSFDMAIVKEYDSFLPPDADIDAEAHRRVLIKAFEMYGNTSGAIPPEMITTLGKVESLSLLTDTIAFNMHLEDPYKKDLLKTPDIMERAHILIELLQKESQVVMMEKALMEMVKISIDKGQKEFFLREQLKVIQKELGDKTGTFEETVKYNRYVDRLPCDDDTKAKLRREIQRLSLQQPGSPEGIQIKMYLDTVLELPWGRVTKDMLSVEKASNILNRDHYGLEKVKERILEFLAVRKLKSENGATDIKGPILCLVGPPGVGKTSIARSLAQAIGRKYVRMSLGGVHDEAEIRGHRRTYIGSMPGRFIQAMRQAGTDNPLILLDEVDKLGKDFRGDPSSALLEVLDSEQNHTFRDHYLEIPYNLSKVLFITTANTWESIPQALADRMEMVFLSGYTEEEKLEIAVRHIISRTVKDNGLNKGMLSFTRAGVRDIIRFYTRESGVRELERQIAKVCRKAAVMSVSGKHKNLKVTPSLLEELLGKKLYRHEMALAGDQVGIATGLAWTPSGGDTLSIEVELMEGTGKIELTGQLGEVMRESAKIAITYVRSKREIFGIDKDLASSSDIHIHVPAGATPKDGPSAGITLATALVSAITGRAVRHDVAMTGELTLRGQILPVGGVKEKLIAAVRSGIKVVLIPAENKRDIEDLPQTVRSKLDIRTVEDIREVFDEALISK